MKILLISSFLPYPLFSGGQVRLFNLIKELSEKHEITLICEKRKHQTNEDEKEVEKICKKVITIDRRKQWSLGNLLTTLISSNSFLVTGHTNSKMKSIIKEELENNKFDLIHVETFYVMQNLPQISIPVVLAEHNIEYQVYDRFAKNTNFLIRPLLMPDIIKIKREEEKFWQRATKLIAVSESDAKVMQEKGRNPMIVANGVDTEKFAFKGLVKQESAKKILFIGDFKWLQNRDAVKFIIEEIWPEIRSKIKNQKSKIDIKLWIIGRKIPDSIRSLTDDPDVVFDEESSGRPTEDLFQEADILLAPIRVGGGTSYKILESMSSGTPVVTTPLSAGAIGAKDGENILAGKNSQELAEKTLELLSDQNLYEKIAKNGRAFIEQKYTWKKIANDLERVYENVI